MYPYEIIDVLTHDDNERIDINDIIIMIKVSEEYKLVTVKYFDHKFHPYADWQYINNEDNILEFTDRVKRFNTDKRKGVKQ